MKTAKIKTVAGSSSTIGFRLDPAIRKVLDERANYFERSVHDVAKTYVIESLMAGEERQQLRESISSLESQISELREEIAHAVRVLLVSAGKTNPEQAEAFVSENFNLK